MKVNNKIQTSIHLLNTHLFEATSFDEIIREVKARVDNEGKYLKEAKFTNEHSETHLIRLFYLYNPYPPKWRGFFEPFLDKESPLCTAINVSYSFICFICFKEQIFVITGGFGAQKISHLLIPNFGLEVLVRLFQKDSKVVKNIQDRGFTGNILGQTKFYRGDQKFSDENQFGKIFKQVQAELNRELLKDTFGFLDEQLKRNKAVCMAKDSFQINKSVDFNTMLTIISKLADLLKKRANFSLNKVEHLNRRKAENVKLTEELEAFAENLLYTNCKKGEDCDVDFCHSKFDTFLNADSVKILVEKNKTIEVPSHSTFGEIVRLLKESKYYIDDDETLFRISVLERTIVSYDSDGQKLTSGSVFEHIHGEFNYNGKTYFLIDKEWYTIQQSFIKDLNNECKQILNFSWDTTTLTETFNLKERESVYNQKYLHKPNFFVFDTVTPNNIEICDVMKFDDKNIHLIHVKKGFDNSIRDLASQITISAKLIQQDLRSGFENIDKLQTLTLRRKTGELAKQIFPPKGLKSLFINKSPQQITFYLAFVDKSNTPRDLKNNTEKFSSNIAKFSIIELKRELNAMGFDFKIIQIEKS